MPSMASIPTAAEAFPMLHVSPRDAKTLELMADEQVVSTLEHYQSFLCDQKECVDRNVWRKVETRDSVRLFRERSRTAARRERFEKSGSSVRTDRWRDSYSRSSSSVVTPLVLLVGTLAGNLDDVVYGVQSPSAAAMELQTAYVQDGLSHWAVLAALEAPSRAEPFRDLSLKWAVKQSALPGVRPRDFVYLEAVGFTTTKSGERIGYQVKHSVSLARAPQLDATFGIARAHLSFCYIYRQRSEGIVDVFMRGSIQPQPTASALANRVARSMALDVALAVSRVAYCAQMKKLAWLLQTRKQFASTSVCTEPMRHRTTSASAVERETCRVCCERVCSRCRVTKQLACVATVAGADVVVVSPMRFCTQCLHRAATVSAQSVALYDVLAADSAQRSGSDAAAHDAAVRTQRFASISISTCSLDDRNSQHSSSLYAPPNGW